jgi:hypothetical protein
MERPHSHVVCAEMPLVPTPRLGGSNPAPLAPYLNIFCQRKAAKTADALSNTELKGKHRRCRDTLDSDSDDDSDFAPGGIVI